MTHSAGAKAMMKSIDFHLTMEPLWDGQSYNFKPHVLQAHDRLHFEEGCTNFMHANELDETNRLVISFSVRDYETGDSSNHTFDFFNYAKISYVAFSCLNLICIVWKMLWIIVLILLVLIFILRMYKFLLIM